MHIGRDIGSSFWHPFNLLLLLTLLTISSPAVPIERGGRTLPGAGRCCGGSVCTLRSFSGSVPTTRESEMLASESCSKVGCFLEAAFPAIAPAVALFWMLSIAVFC